MQKNGAQHLIYISERLILPIMRNRNLMIKPSHHQNNEERKAKFKKILKTKVGFIHLVNKYEERYIFIVILGV
jgi:hypothetical protein